MDKIKNYRQIVQALLTQIGNYKMLNEQTADEFETQLIFDEARDHYQLLRIGWEGYKRTFSCSIHIDIKNNKVWIQQNLTEIDVAQKLIEHGVQKTDIVLGMQSPAMRKYTEFAAA